MEEREGETEPRGRVTDSQDCFPYPLTNNTMILQIYGCGRESPPGMIVRGAGRSRTAHPLWKHNCKKLGGGGEEARMKD